MNDGLVSFNLYDIMKVEMGHVDVIANRSAAVLRLALIRVRQARFILFRPEEIDAMHWAILLGQLRKVPVECWLRGMRPCNLNTLREGLEPLLLPEY